MSVKIIEKKINLICPNQLNNGQAGIIKKFPISDFIGTIVIRQGSYLYAPGRNLSWKNVELFNSIDSWCVEILPPGTKLEVTLEV